MEYISQIVSQIKVAGSVEKQLEIIDAIPVDIINKKDANGNTILAHISKTGSSAIVEALINKGADVNIKCSRTGWTPLISAVADDFNTEHGIYYNCEVLLEHNANPNIQDYRGRTALMYAAERNFSNIVDLLVDSGYGTRLNIKDKEGFTAYDLTTDGFIKKTIKKSEKRIHDIYAKLIGSLPGLGPDVSREVATHLSFGSKKRSIRKNKKSKTNRKSSRKYRKVSRKLRKSKKPLSKK